MKNKIILISLFSMGIFISGLFFAFPEKNGLCGQSTFDCIELFSEKLAQPLVLMSLSLFITSIFLFFTKPEVFKTWSKFALVAIPLLALWIINTPVSCGGGYINMCFDKESASLFSGVGFFVISLMLIVYKSFKLRTKNILTN